MIAPNESSAVLQKVMIIIEAISCVHLGTHSEACRPFFHGDEVVVYIVVVRKVHPPRTAAPILLKAYNALGIIGQNITKYFNI